MFFTYDGEAWSWRLYRQKLRDRVGGDWLRTGTYVDDDEVWMGSVRLSGNTVLLGSPNPNFDRTAGLAKVIRFEQAFSDVSADHWAFRSIEEISLSGITSGCGNGNY